VFSPGEGYSCAGDQCGIEVDYDEVAEKVEKEKTYEEETPREGGTVPKNNPGTGPVSQMTSGLAVMQPREIPEKEDLLIH